MTTLVGIQGDGFAVVGSDTLIISYDSSVAFQKSTLGSSSAKIAANGKYLLGAAGDVRAINLLHHAFQPPTPTAGIRGKKLDSFITVKFIPALRACFDQHGYSLPDARESKDHIAQHDSTILVVVNSTIYLIEGDYSWTSEASGFYAAGTGSPYALGALHAISGGKKLSLAQAKTGILKALAAAAKYDPNSASPYHTFAQTVDKAPAARKR